jgi:oxygen-independent coproporphyrinogen-3 oxidase
LSRPFGIYVHWPFCVSKCPYCDFNSHVRESVDHAAWSDALTAELRHYAAMIPGRTVESVFFGGGTPSLMEPETVQAVLDQIVKSWRVKNHLEVTLEANPTSAEAGKFRDFRQAGINRVSIGIQSLYDKDLKFLGRAHDAAQGRAAIGMAGSIFDRYSFDLIYARPEQTVQDWQTELEAALKLSGGHLSLYQLTIEKGTAFHTMHARGDFEIPESDLAGDFYELTQTVMEGAGMPAYEISNHAKPDHESRHNMIYWRYGDYVGAGPGAHGRLTLDDGRKIGTRAHSAPEAWLERVRAQGHGAHPYEDLSREQRFIEAVMMGLRMRGGVSLDNLSAEAGQPWQAVIDGKKIDALAAEGLLVQDGDTLRPTVQGMQRLNGILGYLLA